MVFQCVIGRFVLIDIFAISSRVGRDRFYPFFYRYHVVGSFANGAIHIGDNRRGNRATQAHCLLLPGYCDRFSRHVGVNLHPQIAFRRAATGNDLIDKETGLVHLPNNHRRTVRNGLHNRPVDVNRCVAERESPNYAATVGINPGSAVPLPVFKHDQSVAARREFRRPLIENIVYGTV